MSQGRKETGGRFVLMSEERIIEQFVQGAVAHALDLPCREAASFLHGLLLIGGEHAALDPVRKAYALLDQSESQLELIANSRRK